MNELQLAYQANNPHAALSGWLLLSIPLSGVVSYFVAGHHNSLNAIALLLIPFAIFFWIFTTIRAMHLVDVWFWSIPTTYVNLVTGIVAVVLCGIVLAASSEAARLGHAVGDTTLYMAASIIYGGGVGWSYFHNWRKTHSAILALSLTILQTISAALVIVVLNLWLDRRNSERYEREHRLG